MQHLSNKKWKSGRQQTKIIHKLGFLNGSKCHTSSGLQLSFKSQYMTTDYGIFFYLLIIQTKYKYVHLVNN